MKILTQLKKMMTVKRHNVSNESSTTEKDEVSSEVEAEEENTSSDDSSEPSGSDDGSIELPFDRW